MTDEELRKKLKDFEKDPDGRNDLAGGGLAYLMGL